MAAERKNHWWTSYSSAIQAISATLIIIAMAGVWALNKHDAYADERYVLKGELKQAIEGLGLALADAEKLRQKNTLVKAIRDLEDEVIAFDEDGESKAAKRRCRKITRNVRDWEFVSQPLVWQADPVVKRVCEG